MTYTFHPQGVCSKEMRVELSEENVIQKVEVHGGCHGNSQGLAALLEGMTAQNAIHRLKGICCGPRSTSCPDQLAKGLETVLAQQLEKN